MAAERAGGFEWDADNIGHVGRHGVSEEEFEQVMRNSPIYTGSQMDERSGEERHREIGHTEAGRVLIVVWTQRGDICRAVTAFKSNRQDREGYYEQKGMAR